MAVERETAVEDMYVQREFNKLVATFWAMRDFLISSVREERMQTFVIQLLILGLRIIYWVLSTEARCGPVDTWNREPDP